jgi:MarR family 2-MHQ and catechol resistance regulon transcriptional repressor
MMKAMRALTKYAAAGIEETGLGLSDFGVLEILPHKGPLPVDTIGPIVDLTPGSIRIAVDHLVAKGLVSRVESVDDRRVRIVALTPRGKDLIASAFRKHSAQMKRVFAELSPDELQGLEVCFTVTLCVASSLSESRCHSHAHVRARSAGGTDRHRPCTLVQFRWRSGRDQNRGEIVLSRFVE